ncbi:MAG: SHOCT domain-containing protein [Bacteroidales bacterium]|nr:SHOCT domain-containing protein [Bacteroidales bacterium]
MAQTRVYTESVITLNGTQANQTMQALQNQADSLRQKMLEATKLGDIEGAKELQKQLDACNKSMSAIRKETKDWGDVLNNLNGSTLGELQKAASGLNKQLRNLKPGTQEFIDKSKQLRQVKDRMNEIQGKTKEVQNAFAGFFTKISWAGLIAGAFGLFKKFAQDMISTTQTMGDKWNQFNAGMSAAYKSFIADLTSGEGWATLLANMNDAYVTGAKVAAILDEIFERENSLKIEESKARAEIAEWERQTKDITLTDKERMQAAQNIIDKEKELAETRHTIAEDELKAISLKVKAQTHLSDEELKYVVDEYNHNRDRILQAREYLEERERLRKQVISLAQDAHSQNEEMIADTQEHLRMFVNAADVQTRALASVLEKYDRSNDKLMEEYVAANVKLNNSNEELTRNTTKAENLLHRLKMKNLSSHTNAVNEAYQKEVKESEAHFKELQNQAKQAYVSGEIDEQEYQQRSAAITKAGWEAKLKLAQKHKEDTASILSSLLDIQMQEKKKMDEWEKASMKELADAAVQILKDAEAQMKELAKEVDAEITEEMDKYLELAKAAQEIRYALDPLQKMKDDFDAEMEQLQEMHDQKLLSEEEYQQALAALQKKYQDQQRDYEGQTWTKRLKYIQDVLNQAGAFMSALQSAAEASLDARMEKELAAAGDNAEERERIEEDYEQKKLDLQKKYADVDMGIQIAQALAAGALGCVQAWNAAKGVPYIAIPIMALITATTAAQVATIIAQRNAIKNQTVAKSSAGSAGASGARVATGYSEGGYTKSSANDYQEVGVVHANEWVAPAAMVRANPITFARLESQRRSGNYRSGVAGYADGGYSGEEAADSVASAESSQNREVMEELVVLLRDLKASLPFKAYVVTSELNKKMEVEQSVKSIVSRS